MTPTTEEVRAPQPGSDEGLIRRLRQYAVAFDDEGEDQAAAWHRAAADRIAAQAQEIAELRALCERLKLEAQCHAQEARTANATIAEIYKVCTGATGEPGNWHGAEPVKAALAEARKDAERLRACVKAADAMRDELRAWCNYCGGRESICAASSAPCHMRAYDSARTSIARGEPC